MGAKTGRKSAVAKRSSGESMPQAGNAAPAAPISRTSTSSVPRSTASVKPATAATLGGDPTPRTAGASSDEQPANTPSASAASQPAAVTPFGSSAVEPADGADASASGDAPAAPVSAAASPGAAVVATPGKASASPGANRPGLATKAALQHPAAALNASPASEADDSSDTATGTSAAPAAALAASVDAAWTAPPSVDGTVAAALVAFAGSRNAYAAAAGDAADDSAAVVTGVAGVVAAASGGNAAMTPAVQEQSALLADAARADKHASVSLDTTPANGTADLAAGLSQLGSSAGASPETAPTPIPTLRVAANVDSADFPQDLSARVSFMVDNNLNGAKLQVNPPQLGPIELRILVNGEHAQVWMSTHSAVTRAALESSAPTLREMLGTQGFSQVSVDISQRSFQERSAYSQPYESTAGRGASVAAASQATVAATQSSQGILDAYA